MREQFQARADAGTLVDDVEAVRIAAVLGIKGPNFFSCDPEQVRRTAVQALCLPAGRCRVRAAALSALSVPATIPSIACESALTQSTPRAPTAVRIGAQRRERDERCVRADGRQQGWLKRERACMGRMGGRDARGKPLETRSL